MEEDCTGWREILLCAIPTVQHCRYPEPQLKLGQREQPSIPFIYDAKKRCARRVLLELFQGLTQPVTHTTLGPCRSWFRAHARFPRASKSKRSHSRTQPTQVNTHSLLCRSQHSADSTRDTLVGGSERASQPSSKLCIPSCLVVPAARRSACLSWAYNWPQPCTDTHSSGPVGLHIGASALTQVGGWGWQGQV